MSTVKYSELRLIAGQWRGRKLKFANIQGLRPTPDRVRETVFNWLQAEVAGSRCLDLFAGSGALGFEAASRGAKSVALVESNESAVQCIKENKALLGADQVHVYCENVQAYLSKNDEIGGAKVNLVFIDPPYQSNYLETTCRLLDTNSWLSQGAKIYIEYDINRGLCEMPEKWQCIKSKKAGQVGYGLFEYNGGE